MITNEYDEVTKFYRQFYAERYIRELAGTFPNSYHVGVFACFKQVIKLERDFLSFEQQKEEIMSESLKDFELSSEEKS